MKTLEIQERLIKDLCKRVFKYFLTNTHALLSEADVLGVSSTGYIYEYEVKISRSDFKAEFRNKIDKHKRLSTRESHKVYDIRIPGSLKLSGEKEIRIHIPNRFFFACPEGLIKPEEVPEYAGLVYVYPYDVKVIKKAPLLHKIKVNSKLIEYLAHSLSFRLAFGCSYMTYRNNKNKENEKH